MRSAGPARWRAPARTASEAVTRSSANSGGRPTSARSPNCWSNGLDDIGMSTTGWRGWILSTGHVKQGRKGVGMGQTHNTRILLVNVQRVQPESQLLVHHFSGEESSSLDVGNINRYGNHLHGEALSRLLMGRLGCC